MRVLYLTASLELQLNDMLTFVNCKYRFLFTFVFLGTNILSVNYRYLTLSNYLVYQLESISGFCPFPSVMMKNKVIPCAPIQYADNESKLLLYYSILQQDTEPVLAVWENYGGIISFYEN